MSCSIRSGNRLSQVVDIRFFQVDSKQNHKIDIIASIIYYYILYIIIQCTIHYATIIRYKDREQHPYFMARQWVSGCPQVIQKMELC